MIRKDDHQLNFVRLKEPMHLVKWAILKMQMRKDGLVAQPQFKNGTVINLVFDNPEQAVQAKLMYDL